MLPSAAAALPQHCHIRGRYIQSIAKRSSTMPTE
jgi:hypothetical protein